MKNILFIILLIYSVNNFSQTGIGTTTPNASARLDISSTTKGFLPPRMNSSQRDVIVSPATGLVIYNTTTNNLDWYNGSNWSTKAYYCRTAADDLYINQYFNSTTITEI